VLLLSGWLCPTLQGAVLTFTAGTVQATPSSPVSIPITVANFNNVAGFTMALQWNSGVLEYTGVGNLNLKDLEMASFNNVGNVLNVSWNEINTAGVTVPSPTTIFE